MPALVKVSFIGQLIFKFLYKRYERFSLFDFVTDILYRIAAFSWGKVLGLCLVITLQF